LIGSGGQLCLKRSDLGAETVGVAVSSLILRPLELIDKLAELQFQAEGMVLDPRVGHRHRPNALLF